MKIIESSVEVIEEKDPYKMIELAGRTCYKSEDKITEDSAKEFVDKMIKLGHGAMLEHGTVYLEYNGFNALKYANNPYSRVSIDHVSGKCYITTNMRVLIENGWLDDLQYQVKPTEHHVKRITAKFICDRGVSHEIVRHRVMSFAQESQRYCNYSKDKFNSEITFIKPTWYNEVDDIDKEDFYQALKQLETYYINLINKRGLKPQEARAVLPNATKTEIVVTGFESDWAHFFSLRRSKASHPDMQKLANELYDKIYGEEKQ